ncbi:peptidyl-prolyl cis-trans isomerase-like 2 [Radiomyces spectabilis]|uniref:peptidyl-prolyl cis-trans isomerase-like 2 n=1 Tax=Radiomyces spectabilis TaxID=64574 RepID=UPI00221EC084|nr:peptidyl-prolyl cis-trans isomerase-like 2 [Radiomyces spectabilis]KAI8376525.1 peptidyl-prolyl cis-trans isomerase-like 2 [Radiomyces spectabilis]
MGKWTDKLYITHSEWSGEVGQHGASSGTTGRTRNEGFRRLPFYCCSLSLQPFEHPVCTADGIVFDLIHIIPYIKKYGTNPVTGEPLAAKDLIQLHFHKNDKDEYYCPVTYKVFSDHTAIAAIKTSGNVFAYDTIERLNIKAKYWRDLLTDEPFTRKDIIMIQDPHNLEKRNMSKFHYLKHDLKVVNAAEEREKRKAINNINVAGIGGTAGRVLAELQKKEDGGGNDESTTPAAAAETTSSPTSAGSSGTAVAAVKKEQKATIFHPKKAATPYNAAHYSTGRAAASFTSTAVDTVTVNERALIDEEEFMYKYIKTKGYARIMTNFGNLNIELYCDKAPRACHNFIMLAKSGYYNGVIFHRNIKNFMIQGGDPTGTGRGGESYWKQPFPDEIKFNLSHDDRGILSMANKGKDTNGSQFFITYGPCTQLDRKHTIFGRVVGGLDVLNKMEAVPVDDADRPERDIRMREVSVFVDPYEEYTKRLKRKLEREANAEADEEKRRQQREKEDSMGWFGPNIKKKLNQATSTSGGGGGGIGKYLQSSTQSVSSKSGVAESDDIPSAMPPKKPKLSGRGYGNFDNF